jgi:hypothetical protein
VVAQEEVLRLRFEEDITEVRVRVRDFYFYFQAYAVVDLFKACT